MQPSRDLEILGPERAAAAQRRRNINLGVYGGIGVVSLAMMAPLLYLGPALWLFAMVALVLAGGFSFGMVALIGNTQPRNPYSLTTGGPRPFGQIYTPAPPAEVWQAIQQTALVHQLSTRMISPTTMVLERGIAMNRGAMTYLVDVRESIDRPGMGVVSVYGEPKVATAVTDAGLNESFLNSLLLSVPGRELPAFGPQIMPARPRAALPPRDRFRSQ